MNSTPRSICLRLGCAGLGAWLLPTALFGQTNVPANKAVPYSLPVVLPGEKASPPMVAVAPYTPTVISLIKQLEPHSPPTLSELKAASRLLSTQGGTYAHPEGSNSTCHNLANVNVNVATTPRIMPLCFSDGLGIDVDSGANECRRSSLKHW